MNSRNRSRATRRRATMPIERLEPRLLFATLTIDGTVGNDSILVDVTDNGGSFIWSVNGAQGSSARSLYTALAVNGLDGDDHIEIQRNGNLTTFVDGGIGDDTIEFQSIRGNLNDSYVNGNIYTTGSSGFDQMFAWDDSASVAKHYGADGFQLYIYGSSAVMHYGNDVESVALTTGTQNDVVDVPNSFIGTRMYLGSAGGADTVNVGDATAGGMSSINGPVQIQNATGSTTLNITDQSSSFARNAYLDPLDDQGSHYNVLRGMGPSTVTWNTAGTTLVNITTGPLADSVTVRGADVFTNIQNGGSTSDTYCAGITATLQYIHSVVQFLGGPGGGSHVLNIDDGADTTARNLTIDYGQLYGSALSGAIHWDVASTTQVYVNTGTKADNVQVVTSSNPLQVSNPFGSSRDSVRIGNGVFGGTLSGITSNVHIQANNLLGTAVTVDDDLDTSARTGTMTVSGSIEYLSGLSAGTISFEGSAVGVDIKTGSAADTLNVQQNLFSTRLYSFGGNDVVFLGNAGSMQALAADVQVYNNFGTTTVALDDYNDAVGRNITLDKNGPLNAITGLSPGAVYWDPAAVGMTVYVNAGTSGDNFSLNGAADGANQVITLNGGGGNDLFTVNDFTNLAAAQTIGHVLVNGGAATDRLFINNAANNTYGAGGSGYGVGDGSINQALIDGIGNFTPYRIINHTGVETLQLTAGPGHDLIFANAINPTVQTMIVDGGGGDDNIEVEQNAPGGVTIVRGTASLAEQDHVLVEANGTPGAAQFDARIQLASLTVTNGATASVVAGGDKLLTVSSLSITGTGKLDLNDNDMIVRAPQILAVQAYVNSARNGGLWTGTGLTSSTAKNNPAHNTTLGVMNGGDYTALTGSPVFDGALFLNNSDVLIKYTYNGDANFDGRVTFDDYVRIDTGFNAHRSGWSNGDFNLDGVVNFDDYVLIDTAFNTQGAALGRLVTKGGAPRPRSA